MLQTIERLRLSDMVADRIRGYIQENSLQPGDRLPTEYQFAERLGVSRLAVREATKALEVLGIVDASPRRGLTVGALDGQLLVADALLFGLLRAFDRPLFVAAPL